MLEPQPPESSRRPFRRDLPWIVLLAAVLAFDIFALSGGVRGIGDVFAWVTEAMEPTEATPAPPAG